MNEAAFLAALHESPNDEVTWLALADWFEDNGQPQRAELVRLVRQLRTVPVMKRTKARVVLEDRVAALLNAGVPPVALEVVNSIGMRLALIPPGVFRMGSPASERSHKSDETSHEVEITRAYYLGVFPVTQGQYQSVMGSNPSAFCDSSAPDQTRDFPVERVSWDDAAEFCRRLSKLDGRTYRLPTEAEWEYACRGGSACTGPFHYGISLSSTQANFHGEYPYGKAKKGPHLKRPTQVGSYKPNLFGLYDMHGNVTEWCNDHYHSLYYDRSPRTDPPGPAGGPTRVKRGGNWRLCGGSACRAARRSAIPPNMRQVDVGFRVAANVG
jgi:uncharacterized protein (TIGR02996 family)